MVAPYGTGGLGTVEAERRALHAQQERERRARLRGGRPPFVKRELIELPGLGDAVRGVILTQDQVSLIDLADASAVSRWNWHALPRSNSSGWYAARTERLLNNRARTIYLHRQLLDAPLALEVDHINGDSLDNRRANLRLATGSQNRVNKHTVSPTTGFRGVKLDRRTGNYQAQIKLCRRARFLGSFSSSEAAARAYDQAAREFFGPFARLNFPDEPPRAA